jgi:hypothetical protein
MVIHDVVDVDLMSSCRERLSKLSSGCALYNLPTAMEVIKLELC